jgi:uncharacterized protein (TIGR03066 family)
MRACSMALLAVVACLLPAPAFGADSAKELIIGKWQPNDKDNVKEKDNVKATVEFTKDGKIKIVADAYSLEGTFKFLNDNQIEVTMPIAGKDSIVKLTVKVTKDELTTTDETKDDKAKDKKVETFKRVQ